MTKLVTFLGRKAAPEAGKPLAAKAPVSAPPEKTEIELDNELFSPIATLLGQENEAVSKTLRAYEETKSEKLSLQGALNSTRVAYDKLRVDLTATEKKAAASDA